MPLRHSTTLTQNLINQALDESPDRVEVVDAQGRVVALNECARRAYNAFGRTQALNCRWLDLWPDENRPAIAEALHRAQAGEVAEVELFSIESGERPRFWDAVIKPVYGSTKSQKLFVVTARDISEQRRRKSESIAATRRYKALIDASAVLIWRADANGSPIERYSVDSDHSHAKIALVGADWLDAVHPDDRERVSLAWQNSLGAQKPFFCEYRMRSVDGLYRWVLSRAVIIKQENGALEWVGTVSDDNERKIAEETTRAAETRLRIALEASQSGIWEIDLQTHERYWSEVTRSILGISESAPLNAHTFENLVLPSDRAHMIVQSRDTKVAEHGEFRIVKASTQEVRWVSTHARVLRDAQGSPMKLIGTIRDVTEKKVAESALRESEERLLLALKAGRMVAWSMDIHSGHVTRSENSVEVLGISSCNREDFERYVHPDDRHHLTSLLSDANAGEKGSVEVRYRGPTGKDLWLAVRAQRIDESTTIGITFDITDRKAIENEIWHIANHDPLTGLANRALFKVEFQKALDRAKSEGCMVGLFLLDLDNFKEVNDTLGHQAGDDLLRTIADAIMPLVRSPDTVARLGGDEFAIVALRRTEKEIVETGLRLLSAVRSTPPQSSASIGLAIFPSDHELPSELMKNADLALYQAKAAGRNRLIRFERKMRDVIDERATIRKLIRKAISEERVVPFYQPKVCLQSGRIFGFEALARWQHETGEILGPSRFMHALEDADVSIMLGEVIRRQVARDLRKWVDLGLECGTIAVNVASPELTRSDFVVRFSETLNEFRLHPRYFELEITEGVFLGQNSPLISRALYELHETGVRIALDDFGTGFASLSHLKQYPVDHLKIDRSFISGLGHDRDDTAIVRAVIALGKSLDLDITAEGIETRSQAARLKRLGCTFGQGFLFAKPMPGEAVINYLSSGKEMTSTPAEVPWPIVT